MFLNKYVYHEEFVSFFIMYQYDSLAPFQLKHEFTMVVAGPSKSGKTEFVKNLINNAHWISPPERVVCIVGNPRLISSTTYHPREYPPKYRRKICKFVD